MSSIIKVDQIQTAAGGTPTAADLGMNTTGTVLQVKATTLTGRYSISNQSDTGAGTDIGLNVTITPKSSSSQFLITVNVGAAGTTGVSWGAILSRNNSKIGHGDTHAGYSGGVLFRSCWVGHLDYNHTQGGGSGQYLDTTSGTVGTAITYRCGFGIQNNGGTLRINSDYNQYTGSHSFAHSTSVSTITVMEIEG